VDEITTKTAETGMCLDTHLKPIVSNQFRRGNYIGAGGGGGQICLFPLRTTAWQAVLTQGRRGAVICCF